MSIFSRFLDHLKQDELGIQVPVMSPGVKTLKAFRNLWPPAPSYAQRDALPQIS